MLSRRSFLLALAGAALQAALAACSAAISSVTPSPTPASPSPTPSPTPSTAPSPSPSPAGPSLRERIGQMLLVGFRGRTAEDVEPVRRLIADGSLGGFLLFSVDQLTGQPRNVSDPDQLRALVGSLAGAATAAPLLVAVDEEGGQVARLGPATGFPPTQSAAALGTQEPSEARAAGRAIAETLASVGITLNLAPVVDLAINPDNPIIAAVDRSFGVDPTVVTEHAAAFIAGHREIGVRTAIKHFPGQGSASGDTHLGIVDVTGSWTDVELEPFRRLVADGSADAVLTAHIFNATLDPERPATLSEATVGGLLRRDLGFDGVVISDDLQMGAIREAFGFEEAIELSIRAGIDLLLIANQLVYEPDVATRTINVIEGLVADGRVSEARIDASYQRILRLKG